MRFVLGKLFSRRLKNAESYKRLALLVRYSVKWITFKLGKIINTKCLFGGGGGGGGRGREGGTVNRKIQKLFDKTLSLSRENS